MVSKVSLMARAAQVALTSFWILLLISLLLAAQAAAVAVTVAQAAAPVLVLVAPAVVPVVVAPLVLFSIAASIADFGDMQTLGRIAGKVIGSYMVTALIAIHNKGI